jgi:hypothetical protein
MQSSPAMRVRTTVRDAYSRGSPPASGAIAAAVMAQVAASGPTMSCREVPKSAYATSGRMLAYRPVTGGRPTSSA